MSITTSSIPAALDYLVGAVTTAMGDQAHVFDGPPLNDTALQFQERAWIGYSPINPELPAATGDQEFAALGARSRNETFALVCAVEFWNGGSDLQPLRAGAFALLRLVETLLRGTGGDPGDTTLGGAVLWSQIAGGIEVYQGKTDAGPSVLIQFHISCRARLTAN